MHRTIGAESVHDSYGGGAWWGFAFIVFIIFAIIMAFCFLANRRHGDDDRGWEKLLPFLALLKGKYGEEGGYAHTEIIKDQAVDTGKIIHNQDVQTERLQVAIDKNGRLAQQEVNEMRREQLERENNKLLTELSEAKTCNAIERSHGDLKRDVSSIKEYIAPGWYKQGHKHEYEHGCQR